MNIECYELTNNLKVWELNSLFNKTSYTKNRE